MVSEPNSESKDSFFVTGGTLSPDASSYIKRSADDQLLAALLAGKYCYVLNSRQMGKSSICVRTMRALQVAGTRTSFVDLTRIGGKNVTADQWYIGLAVEIGRAVDLRNEILSFWKANTQFGSMQKLFGALREVVLAQIKGTLVIFLDEIDATRSLSFSTDEFFAGIRECFNRRVQDPEYERLSFCLLGVAVPTDLITNPTSTPFNIGERIYLRDFTLNEIQRLADGLPGRPIDVLERIFFWTGGHPFLTQSLCARAAETKAVSSRDIDGLVERELLDPTAKESNVNLSDVANRALRAGEMDSNPIQFRSDLLSVYQSAWKGKFVPDDESNRISALLKLSGIMKSDGRRLMVRNRIYRKVFDLGWVRENMPNQEALRLRRAFYLGAIRAGSAAFVVLLVIVMLAWRNARLAKEAEVARDQAQYESYVADVGSMRTAFEDNDNMLLARLLSLTKNSPARNLEWWYWFGKLHSSDRELEMPRGIGQIVGDSIGKSILVEDPEDGMGIYDFPDLNPIYRDNETFLPTGGWRDAGKIVIPIGSTWEILTRDAQGLLQLKSVFNQGKISTSRLPNPNTTLNNSEGGQFLIGSFRNQAYVWHTPDLNLTRRVTLPGNTIYEPAISNDGRFIAYDQIMGSQRTERSEVVIDTETGKEVDRFRYPAGGGAWSLNFSSDGKLLGLPTASGHLYVRNIASHQLALDVQIGDCSQKSAQFSRKGDRLVSVGSDLVARVWDLRTKRQIYSETGAIDAWLSPNGKDLAVGGQGTRIYAVDDSGRDKDSRHMNGLACATAVTAQGLVITGGASVRFLDPENLAPIREVPLPSAGHGAYATDDGAYCFSLNPDGSARMFETNHLKFVCKIEYCNPQWAPSVSTLHEEVISVDNAATSVTGTGFDGHRTWITPLPARLYGRLWLSPDQKLVAASCTNGKTLLIDVGNGHLDAIVSGSYAGVRAVAFARDRLAIGSEDHQIYIYDLSKPTKPVICFGHSGYVRWAQFSPDGTRLLTSSQDGTARLWDAMTGEEVLNLGNHGPDLRTAIFNRDGTRIYTSPQAPNREIRIYRVPVGKTVQTIN